jgi:hypothetical protein
MRYVAATHSRGVLTGSGRGTVDAHLSLDVNHLQRKNILQPCWVGDLHWVREGEKIGTLSVRAEADQVHLFYRVQISGEPADVNETVRIARKPCRLGGSRPYFICPGAVKEAHCGRRVCKLYLARRYFLCRHCYGLAYASQREGPQDRRLRRVVKLRQRLGGDSYTKPKGMWQRTYERLREQAVAAEVLADIGFEAGAERLVARLDKKSERLKKKMS